MTKHVLPQESVDATTSTSHRPNGNVIKGPPTITEVDAHQPTLGPRQFPRDNLLLQEKLGEGEYGPIYRYVAFARFIPPQLMHHVYIHTLNKIICFTLKRENGRNLWNLYFKTFLVIYILGKNVSLSILLELSRQKEPHLHTRNTAHLLGRKTAHLLGRKTCMLTEACYLAS